MSAPRDLVGWRPSILWFWITAASVVVLDLLTKWIVTAEMPIGGPAIEVLGDVFQIRHVRNSGGLFGLFPGNAIYFAAISAVAVAVILSIVYRSRTRERVQQTALGLVLGGALGNLHDRIRFHEVVDFLDVGVGTHRWPTFNVADSGVTVGVSVLVVWLFVVERRADRERRESVDANAGSGDENASDESDAEPRALDRST